MSVAAPPNSWSIACDILDPPLWEPAGRDPLYPHQLPPTDDQWDLWLLEAGRGAGKTEACARYYAREMRRVPGMRGRIIAPTFGDAVEACIIGPSGLLSVDPEAHWNPSAAGGAKISWPNGSEALVIGTYTPRDVDRLRAGGNRELDWWEEMAANPQLEAAWDQAAFGLRLGDWPRSIGSTTPRNTTAYRAVRQTGEVRLVKASMYDNLSLPQRFFEKMNRKYGGTRLGRQEIGGELLDDIEGALWTRRMVEAARWTGHVPDMAVVVVAVDPAATSSDEADDTGIIVVGLGVDGYAYVLDDRTCHLDPDGWGQRAVRAYHKWNADVIVGEVNNGGEMVEFVVQTADASVPFKKVHASRGKATRAQPVAALYGDGGKRESRVRHVSEAPLSDLEDQLTTWVPGEEDSPDRLDSLTWGLTELFFAEFEEEDVVEEWTPAQIGADI